VSTTARADDAAATPKAPAIASPDGVPVTFMSRSGSTVVYLAHGDVPENAEPDPFEKIGVVPVTIKLAPGTYTLETEGPTQSNGHQRFAVEHDSPLTVQIHPGDPSLKTFGSVLIALGVVSAALGVIAIVSISKDDSHYDRWGIGLPLGIGGVAGAGIGFAMTAMGSTDVHVPHLAPGTGQPSALVPTLVLRF
jgi:hypothetical protein